ncbi:unnamed protein product [Tuber aestivum]|uniref:Uncharacterized protein n=1 Tax=Tuber aestivum TaxID=59557 RepID=A0A292PYZ8_9PEZI|nr:unnamed protein product [Tuber aestivum]
MVIEAEIDLRTAYDACISAINNNPAPQDIEGAHEARENFLRWDQRISAIPQAYTRQAVAILRNTEMLLADSEIGSVVGGLRTATEKLEELAQKGFDDEELSYMLRGLSVSNKSISRGEDVKKSPPFVPTASDYIRALETRTPGSAEWIFATPGYTNWTSTPSEGPKILWVNAPDGLGKTVLAARIVQELFSSGEAPVAYFFSSHEDSIRRVTTNILRSWIDQLSILREEGGKAAQGLPEDKVGKEEDLWQNLSAALQDVGKSYFVLDGLDECLDYDEAARSRTAGVRGVFLKRLLDMIHTTGVRLCVLSRDVSDIRSAIEREHDRSLDSHSVFEIPAGPEDFAADSKLLAQEIVEEKFAEETPELRRELAESISLRSGGSMLWVRRAGDLLKPWMSEDQLKETLSSLPTSLPQLYKSLLEKVIEFGKEERDRAKEILRWALFAERPLSVKELTEALVLKDGDATFPKERLPPCIDEGYINNQILRLCAGLVEVRRQGAAPEAWTIHITHSSTKDFLTYRYSKTEREDLGRLSEFTFSDYHLSHGVLANTCLSYSMLEDIHMVATMVDFDSTSEWPPLSSTSPSLSRALKPYSLFQYATSNWTLHTQQNADYDAALYPRISAALTHPRKARKYGISRPSYHSPEWHQVLFFHEHAPALAKPISPLDTCVRFGILHGAKLLLRNITPVSHPETYVRALWMAVYYHHPSLVTFLLAKGADVNATGNLGSAVKFGSALHIAVKLNFTDVAQILISQGAKVNAQVGEYGTILNTAVAGGTERMVEILLDAGADLSEAPTRYGNALVLAVAMRKNVIAGLLLSRGADIHAQCGAFGNVLSVAARGGDVYMVEMLLERGAEVNSIGGFFGTALQAAAAKGELQVVNMLMGAGADINLVAGHYGSALRAARGGGFAEVEKVLVDAGAVE